MKEKLANLSPLLSAIGLIAVLAGTAMPLILGLGNPAATYTYAAGALILLASRMMGRYDGKNLRIKRLKRMEFWAALIFCAGAALMFYPHSTFQDTLAFTLAGAVLQAYISLMLPRAQAKADKNTDLQN